MMFLDLVLRMLQHEQLSDTHLQPVSDATGFQPSIGCCHNIYLLVVQSMCSVDRCRLCCNGCCGECRSASRPGGVRTVTGGSLKRLRRKNGPICLHSCGCCGLPYTQLPTAECRLLAGADGCNVSFAAIFFTRPSLCNYAGPTRLARRQPGVSNAADGYTVVGRYGQD